MSQLLSPILLTVCETEQEEVDDHERQHRRPRDGQVQLTVRQSRVQIRTQARFKPANMCTLRDVFQETILLSSRGCTPYCWKSSISAWRPHTRRLPGLGIDGLHHSGLSVT